MVKKSICWHCSINVVLQQENDVEGYKHGVVPLWIWDKSSSSFIKNIDKHALCLKCANSRVDSVTT